VLIYFFKEKKLCISGFFLHTLSNVISKLTITALQQKYLLLALAKLTCELSLLKNEIQNQIETTN
jgi:hypothetical protein